MHGKIHLPPLLSVWFYAHFSAEPQLSQLSTAIRGKQKGNAACGVDLASQQAFTRPTGSEDCPS